MLVLTQLGIRSGTIGTIAGVGEPGCSGDGGPATQAALSEPKSVALDGDNHLYIADAENHRIRMVDLRSGTIVTVAGCAAASAPIAKVESSEPVDSLDDPFGEPVRQAQYTQVSDLSGTVRFVVGGAPGSDRFAGDGGLARQAKLNFPSAIAVGPDRDLYIADTMNHRVRKVDLQTGTITTMAGTGQPRYTGDGGAAGAAALNEPTALAIHAGYLYIADQSNNRVRQVELTTGRIATVAGTGEAAYSGDGMPATDAALAGPSGLAVGPDGTLYISDTFNGRIRAVDPVTGLIRTVAGDGGEYRYQAPNEFSTSLSRPYGIALDSGGSILITDSDSHLIRRWDRKRTVIGVVAGNGVADFAGDGGPPLASSLNYPFGVVADQAGNVYIADTFNHRVRVIAHGP
jgi:sugar lactone lactonase YvrE